MQNASLVTLHALAPTILIPTDLSNVFVSVILKIRCASLIHAMVDTFVTVSIDF